LSAGADANQDGGVSSGPGAGSGAFPGPAGQSSFSARGPAAPRSGAGAGGASSALAGSDQENYQAAFNLVQARRYPEAATAFENFLTSFPQSPLADNAQYWLAETHYVQRDFMGALPEFEKVVEQYPQSAKLADALLKVGYCNYELKQFDQARAALERVMREYPDTTAARLASQRLDRLAQDAG
jgi:tol-pal system protein YbgF